MRTRRLLAAQAVDQPHSLVRRQVQAGATDGGHSALPLPDGIFASLAGTAQRVVDQTAQFAVGWIALWTSANVVEVGPPCP